MDTKDNRLNISSVSNDALEQLDRRNHALDGAVFLTSTSNFGGGAGIAPTRRYSGFIVLDVPTISSITFADNSKYLFAPSQDITTFDEYFIQGAYYPLDFTTLTITAGVLMLIQKP